MIVSSNKPFSAWGEIFGGDMAATAMIDRLTSTPKSSASKATATASAAQTSTPDQPGPTPNRSAAPTPGVLGPWGGLRVR